MASHIVSNHKMNWSGLLLQERPFMWRHFTDPLPGQGGRDPSTDNCSGLSFLKSPEGCRWNLMDTMSKCLLTVSCFKMENVALLQLFTTCTLQAGTSGDLLRGRPVRRVTG